MNLVMNAQQLITCDIRVLNVAVLTIVITSSPCELHTYVGGVYLLQLTVIVSNQRPTSVDQCSHVILFARMCVYSTLLLNQSCQKCPDYVIRCG
jgi:hypothetical protein